MKKTLLITLISMVAIGSQAQDCTDLFISEYVVGAGNNRALEIYNPTQSDIDLSDYSVGRFRNGAINPMLVSLAGIIPALGTYVIAIDKRDPNGTGFEAPIDAALEAVADTFVNGVYVEANSPFYFNGDDAVPLIKGTTELLDLLGKIGEDPGTAWSDVSGTWWTTDKTLIRKSTILTGDSDGNNAFVVEAEWDSLPSNTFTELGWHNCACATIGISEQRAAKINMFPNPSANKQLMVSASRDMEMIRVYNILGVEVEQINLTNRAANTYRLNLDALKTGIYIVRIGFEDGVTLSRKVMLGQ